MATVLILRTDANRSAVLPEMLEKLKHRVIETNSTDKVLGHAASGDADVIIVDQESGAESILQALANGHTAAIHSIPVVVVSSRAQANEVIEVMKLGAFDHLIKPLVIDDLACVIDRAVAKPKVSESNLQAQESNDFIFGIGPSMRRVEKLIGMAAASEATILVTGETGTGKDAVSRLIHDHSRHKQQPVTIIDCTAVPEDYGSFQSLAAGGRGTIILEEIGDLNPAMQAMLVRALKESAAAKTDGNEAAFRIIANTRYDLISMVKDKQFREDLYYRLNVLQISLPPLRARGSDILALAEVFLQRACADAPKRLSSAAAKLMLDYEWPGNVRELQNLMYHLSVVVRSAIIEESDLEMLKLSSEAQQSSDDSHELDYYSAMATLEKRLLIRALKEANGSRSEAARLLGINRQLLYSKLKAHALMD